MAGLPLVCALFIAGIIHTGTAEQCLYGDSERCAFKCHCLNETECGGPCVSGCQTAPLGYDWMGPACQIGNIALGKPASQTRTWSKYKPQYAVDGKLPTSLIKDTEFCAIPFSDNGRWWVDFGGLYKVYNVTIYFRRNRNCCVYRDGEFIIKVKNQTEDGEVCAYRKEPVYNNNITLECNTSLIGSSVEFYRTNAGRDQNIATICEMVVIGHKYIDCSLCPAGEECSEVTGCTKCPGSYQPDCSQECVDGLYGINCESQCGNCTMGSSCDKVSGVCAEGCQMWWATDKCDVYIHEAIAVDHTVSVLRTTSSSITLTWSGLDVTQITSAYYGYDVEYREENKTNFLPAISLMHSLQGQQAKVDNLTSGTLYEFLITPFRIWNDTKESGKPYPVISQTTSPVSDGKAGSKSRTTVIVLSVVLGVMIVLIIVLATVLLLRKRAKRSKHNQRQEECNTAMATTWDGQVNFAMEPISEDDHEPSGHEEYEKDSHKQRIHFNDENSLHLTSGLTNEDSYRCCQNDHNSISQHDDNNVDGQEEKSVQQEEDDESKTLDGSDASDEILELDKLDSLPKLLPEEHTYSNMLSEHSKPLPVKVQDFEDHTKKRKSDMNIFMAEYMTLPCEDKSRCLEGQKADNRKRNRFHNIFPYDDNRVKLNTTKSRQDYINASYIKGFTGDIEYIATQGPKDITVEDFWSMVWQENCNRIVMLANLKENGKSRCHRYWSPTDGATVDQGPFQIKTKATDITADYTTRIIILKRDGRSRTIRQFHFTTWEDKKRPLHGIHPLLAFHRRVRSFDSDSTGPMVVHCSAGVGRTGTFIAFDILQQQATNEKVIDVYQCVTKLRNQRMWMVQTMEQYILLHDALLEYVKYGKTVLTCSDFENRWHKTQGAGHEKVTELDKHFELLMEARIQPSAYTTNDLDTHKGNPGGSQSFATGFRHILVDSYRAHDSYLVTNMPTPSTVNEFWRLVFFQQCHSVVLLNKVDEERYYWPNKKRNYGEIEVTLVSSKSEASGFIVIREFTVRQLRTNSQQTLSVRHFHLLSWPNTTEFPSNKEDVLKLINMLDEWQQKENKVKSGKTIVHCLTGNKQSGLFCGLSYTLDKMKAEQVIDVFAAVRSVTRRQTEFFQSKAEYIVLYAMCAAYIKQYSTYVNC